MTQSATSLLREAVTEKVTAIVLEALHAQKMAGQVNEGVYLENLGLDSLNIVDVLLGLETEFGIVFDEEELGLEPLESIGTLVAFVLEHQSAAA